MIFASTESSQAGLSIVFSQAGDGSTDVQIVGSGTTTDSGSATWSAAFSNPSEFLGANDNSDYFATDLGTLTGLIGANAIPFANVRLIDGNGFDTFQFNLGNTYTAGESYSISGAGNFPLLPFASFTTTGTFTSTAGDATDFAPTTLTVVPEPGAALLSGLGLLLVLRRSRSNTEAASGPALR